MTGVIFLPEELEHGMQPRARTARPLFREENCDLLGVEYWQDVQPETRARRNVPALPECYPDNTKLDAKQGTT